jgi:hypothetical protein
VRLTILTTAMYVSTASVAVAEPTIDMTLSVTGHISPRCEFDLPDNSVNVRLTDRAGRASLPFTVDCNQPLSLSVSTRNGGLKLRSSEGFTASPGFISHLPYRLDFSVDAANAQPLSFDSDDIQSVPGTGGFGVIPFSTQGSLALSWSPELPLIGGEYGDVIEIRISGNGETNGP